MITIVLLAIEIFDSFSDTIYSEKDCINFSTSIHGESNLELIAILDFLYVFDIDVRL